MKSLRRAGFLYHSRVLEVLISLQRSITLSFYRTGGRSLSFYRAEGPYRSPEQDVFINLQNRGSYHSKYQYRTNLQSRMVLSFCFCSAGGFYNSTKQGILIILPSRMSLSLCCGEGCYHSIKQVLITKGSSIDLQNKRFVFLSLYRSGLITLVFVFYDIPFLYIDKIFFMLMTRALIESKCMKCAPKSY